MKICIFGASSDDIEKIYGEKTYSLSKKLAQAGHSLVFGAGARGLMGAAARGFKENGGFVHGVIPKFFEEGGFNGVFYEADKITRTESMAERKSIMEEECDAFIITPGGIGTMEEFYEVLTLKQLGRHKKAVLIYNINGYYDTLIKFMEEMIDKGFMHKECLELYAVTEDEDKAVEYLSGYTEDSVTWSALKKIGRK